MEKLYLYLFHYNPHTELWTAFKREELTDYFEGKLKNEKLLKARDVNTLVSYLATN